mmetsp:Transcript_8228/g.20798  ORF Transcript_8228/g.20798 Transcript_8228/m.20798 type:complete len:276 (-) Transcript_8228:807-1634(-)
MLLTTSSRCGNSALPLDSAALSVSLSRSTSHMESPSRSISHLAATAKSSSALAMDLGRSMVAQSPMAQMVPALPFTRRFLSHASERRFCWDPSGRASMIFSHSGFSLMPVHHTASPNGTSLCTPVALSVMTTTPSLTSFTCLLSRQSMLARWKKSVAYSAMRRSYADRIFSCRSTILMLTNGIRRDGYMRLMSWYTMSYSSAASSTPVGPAPITTKVSSCWMRESGTSGSVARSKRSLTSRRNLDAWMISLKNMQFSATPGTPKVLGMAPTAVMR